MARKQTNIETLREQHRLAHIAFINAGSAYRAAEAALNKAVFAAAERKARQPRHEYAVVLLDEHGDGIDTRFHDTLAAARKEAIDAIPNLVGDDAEVVGTVIERVRLSDGERTTVEWHGQVSAGWRDEETVECEYCERTLPAEQVTLSYCDDCRAKDAKAAEAAQEPIVARCSHCGEPEEATGPLTDAREGRQLCEDCRGELCADADYARYDD